MRPTIDDHDYEVKIRRCTDSSTTAIRSRSRCAFGREMAISISHGAVEQIQKDTRPMPRWSSGQARRPQMMMCWRRGSSGFAVLFCAEPHGLTPCAPDVARVLPFKRQIRKPQRVLPIVCRFLLGSLLLTSCMPTEINSAAGIG